MKLINAVSVIEAVGLSLAKLPKLAKTKKISEAICFGSRSAYRALLFCFSDSFIRYNPKNYHIDLIDVDQIGVSPTVASASIGAMLACTKADKQALYLTLCATGLSDHPETLVKTIYGNATKWTRDNAFERYASDLAFVAVLESNPALLKYIRDTYEAIQKHLVAVAYDEAKKKRESK